MPRDPSVPTLQAVEDAVQNRRVAEAKAGIAKYLKQRKHSPEAVIQCCDWLRRLGQYKAALKLIHLEELRPTRKRTDTPEGQRLLWAARLLNILGAVEHAEAYARSIEPVSYSDYRILGAITLTHFDNKNAHRLLSKAIELEPDADAYAARLCRINWADSAARLGDAASALRMARDTLARTPEPVLQAIIHQACGEYLARAGKWKEAENALRQSLALFGSQDRTVDRELALKWLGWTLCHLGRPDDGTRLLLQVHRSLHSQGLRAEAWLDPLRMLLAVSGAVRTPESGEAWRALIEYPGLAPGFRAILQTDAPTLPAPTQVLEPWIDLDSDEACRNGSLELGIPHDLLCLAWIQRAGTWGIGFNRLQSMIWSDEPYSFLQLENRLHQLLHRLRSQRQVSVQLTDRMLSLPAGASSWNIQGNGPPGTSPPRLLRGRPWVAPKDIQATYNLSKVAAWKQAKSWVDRGWLAPTGQGRNSRYTVLNPAPDTTQRTI